MLSVLISEGLDESGKVGEGVGIELLFDLLCDCGLE